MTTLRGGGGSCLPDIVINLRPNIGGFLGGDSRITYKEIQNFNSLSIKRFDSIFYQVVWVCMV